MDRNSVVKQNYTNELNSRRQRHCRLPVGLLSFFGDQSTLHSW